MVVPPRFILILEDEGAHVEAIRRAFETSDLPTEILSVSSLQEYREQVANRAPDLAILDLNLPDGRAVDVLVSPPENGPCPVVLMTSYGSEEIAVEAIKAGALDYVVKSPQTFAKMPQIAQRVLREWNLLQKNRQAEEALRKSEEKYRLLFETMAQGVVYQTSEGSIISANPAAERILGLTREQMIGRNSFDPNWRAIREDGSDLPGSEHPTMVALRTGQVVGPRIMGILQPGQTAPIWLSATATPLFLPGETAVSQVYAIFDDITERRRAEMALAKESALRRILFEQSPDGVLIIDPETTRLLEFNTAAHRQLGYSREEFAQLHIFDLEAQEGVKETQARIAKVLLDGRADFETRQRTRQGEIRDVHVTAQILNVQNRQVYHCIWRDITERKRAEKVLRESEKRHRTILQTALDGFWLTDTEGRLLEVNAAYCQMSGYSAQELLSLHISDLTTRETNDEVGFHIQKIINRHRDRFESRHRRKDGSLFEVEVSVQYQPDMGGRLVVFLRDITAHKRIEEVLAFLAQTSSGTQEESFFEVLVRYLTLSLNLDFAGIGQLEEDGSHIRTLAVWCDGQPGENRTYPLTDTPYEAVVGKTACCCFPAGVRQLFPQSQLLQDLRAECYVGATLESHTGQPIGLIVAIGRHPLANPSLSEEILKLMAERASAELERLEVERALRESDEKNRLLLNSAAEAIYGIDINGNCTFCNKTCLRLLGYKHPDELIGKNMHWQIHSHYPDKTPLSETECRIYRAIHQGKGAHAEDEVFWRADGTAFPVEYWSYPLSRDNQIIGAVVTFLDITERKQMDKVRTLNSERTQALLQLNQMAEAPLQEITSFALEQAVRLTQSRIGYLAFLNEEETILTMHAWSKSAAEMCDMVDKPFIYPVEKTGLWGEAIRQRRPIITNDYASSPWKKGLSEGHVPIRRHMNVPIFANSRIVLVVGVGNKKEEYGEDELQQLTLLMEGMWRLLEHKREKEEKTRLEEQLQQAQKMESVGRLAGGVAHDFNNMLSVILGHAEMALEQVDPLQPLHTDLQEIRKAAERSANLTRQLLAFARKQTVAPRELDLNETVEGMLKMLKHLIGENITLVWKPEDPVWPVKMDPSQIDQILANLCVNARDAIRGLGQIAIETENVSFDSESCAEHMDLLPGQYVRLTVSDNGCGMDKETLAQVFEPFFTTKGLGRGTGLGLSTVYGIVKQNNGLINVSSEPTRGTTFSIYLPRYQGAFGQNQLNGTGEQTGKGSETILLVEDEQPILELTSTLLKHLGYTVLATSSPTEALRLAEHHL
ncbi:MAG TPA: PAS domain S-box protein, partial [Candidatus Sumerlaeota bacterium]|nr:PAS domain S-box protein [Candidatus Sumerlaeota bacterium]